MLAVRLNMLSWLCMHIPTQKVCLLRSLTSIATMPPRVQSGLRTILQEGTLLPRTQMLIQNFFSAVSYGVMDPDSVKEKARLKTQEDNRKLGFPDRPVHGLPPRIPVGLDLVDTADARCAFASSFAEILAVFAKARCDVCPEQRCRSSFNASKSTRCDTNCVRVMPVLLLPDLMSVRRCCTHQVCLWQITCTDLDTCVGLGGSFP